MELQNLMEKIDVCNDDEINGHGMVTNLRYNMVVRSFGKRKHILQFFFQKGCLSITRAVCKGSSVEVLEPFSNSFTHF